MTRLLVCLATVTLLAVPGVASSAVAGETIEQIKTRRTLRCGVSDGMPGFSTQDATGRWSGLDVDICRAVAAAALGDPERVTFVPLRASARFPVLRLGAIELLARNTTWTLTREAGLKIVFAGISFYDAQAFMVQASSKVTAVAQSQGRHRLRSERDHERGQPGRLLRGSRVGRHAARHGLHGRGRRGVLRRPLRGLHCGRRAPGRHAPARHRRDVACESCPSASRGSRTRPQCAAATTTG